MTLPTIPQGVSILKDTIAELTYPEVAQAAERGAIALWGIGVVEQHGPHLPTGTDIWIPSARLRLVKEMLAAEGKEAIIIPPFYWGVNHVSAAFPASFRVRPEVMIALMVDVMESLYSDGFRQIVLHSGHGDALHNKAIMDAATEAAAKCGIEAVYVAAEGMFKRLGFALDHPAALVTSAPFPAQRPGATHIDLHAGDWETSLMLAINPEVVNHAAIPDLPPTTLGSEDLAKWRQGHNCAREVTPDGYFGNPAAATVEFGQQEILNEAKLIADAILRRFA